MLTPVTAEDAAHQAQMYLNSSRPFEAESYILRCKSLFGEHEAFSKVAERVQNAVSAAHRVSAQRCEIAGDFDMALVHWNALIAREPSHPWAQNSRNKIMALTKWYRRKLVGGRNSRHSFPFIYITGIGRSGSWLLASMMQAFDDSDVLQDELPASEFLKAKKDRITIIKRSHDAYHYQHLLPKEIEIVHIVRHPFDVITSKHLGQENFIAASRWVEETVALQHLLKNRPSTLVVKFEELVARPNEVQIAISSRFSLSHRLKFSEFNNFVVQKERIKEAMHGLRPPDLEKVERFRRNKSDLAFCKEKRLEMEPSLSWVARQFDYDVEI